MTEPPAWVTRRAAASLLCIPPVPSELRLDPGQAEHLVVDLRDQREITSVRPWVTGSVR